MSRQWTSEERAKQAALIQQWKPWEKSTGAKTKKGKKIISLNACKGYKRARRKCISRQVKGISTTSKNLLFCFDNNVDYLEVQPIFERQMANIDAYDCEYRLLVRKYKRALKTRKPKAHTARKNAI